MTILRIVCYSNIFVACCAVGYTLSHYHAFTLQPDYYYLGLIFCGTLSLYSCHRYIAYHHIDTTTDTLRLNFIRSISPLILSIAILSTVLSLVLLYRQPQYISIFIPVLPLAIGYSIPLNQNGFRLRDLPYIKILLIAVTWAYLCTWIPLEYSPPSTRFGATVLSSIVVLAFTLPFDIRDIPTDTLRHVHTLPNTWGAQKTWRIVTYVFILYTAIYLLWATLSENVKYYGYCGCGVYMLIMLSQRKKIKDEIYYSLLLEGGLLIPYLLQFLIQKVN